MKACGVEGTNQGLVTNKTFTSQSTCTHYTYDRFTFKGHDEVRYSTH